MDTGIFIDKIRNYHNLLDLAELAWTILFHQRKYIKNVNFINLGQHPRKIAFVVEGFLFQIYINDEGVVIIKML